MDELTANALELKVVELKAQRDSLRADVLTQIMTLLHNLELATVGYNTAIEELEKLLKNQESINKEN